MKNAVKQWKTNSGIAAIISFSPMDARSEAYKNLQVSGLKIVWFYMEMPLPALGLVKFSNKIKRMLFSCLHILLLDRKVDGRETVTTERRSSYISVKCVAERASA